MHTLNLVNVADIDWEQAEHIGNGKWGCIFSIGEGIVAKIGICLQPAEAMTQQYFYEQHNLALPVFAYEEQVELPRKIQRFYCPDHGPIETDRRSGCSCDMPLGVLCMPRADPGFIRDWNWSKLYRFADSVEVLCDEELGRRWDSHDKNIAWWEDHLVALDFFDPFRPGPTCSLKWQLRPEHQHIYQDGVLVGSR